MRRIRLLTAGESHGPGLVAIVEGLPAGLELDREAIDRDMARRQLGHGRGGRMKIEKDRAEVVAGVRHGRTLGSPVALRVENRDYLNWEERMNPWPVEAEVPEVHLPRPGHADLAGALKFGHEDARNALERASARQTAVHVAAGAVAKSLLAEIGIAVAVACTRVFLDVHWLTDTIAGLFLGFQSGKGAGGREGLAAKPWFRTVKWQALAARYVARELDVHSIWSWGWADWRRSGPIDVDKRRAACVYLWTRNPKLCNGPAAVEPPELPDRGARELVVQLVPERPAEPLGHRRPEALLRAPYDLVR